MVHIKKVLRTRTAAKSLILQFGWGVEDGEVIEKQETKELPQTLHTQLTYLAPRKNSSRSLSLGTLLCPTACQKKNQPGRHQVYFQLVVCYFTQHF